MGVATSQLPLVLQYVEGDTTPQITATHTAPPIAGYTFSLIIERPDGSTITKAGTILDANAGTVEFAAFAPTDLVNGQLRCQIRVVDNGGNVSTADGLYLNVTKKLT